MDFVTADAGWMWSITFVTSYLDLTHIGDHAYFIHTVIRNVPRIHFKGEKSPKSPLHLEFAWNKRQSNVWNMSSGKRVCVISPRLQRDTRYFDSGQVPLSVQEARGTSSFEGTSAGGGAPEERTARRREDYRELNPTSSRAIQNELLWTRLRGRETRCDHPAILCHCAGWRSRLMPKGRSCVWNKT